MRSVFRKQRVEGMDVDGEEEEDDDDEKPAKPTKKDEKTEKTDKTEEDEENKEPLTEEVRNRPRSHRRIPFSYVTAGEAPEGARVGDWERGKRLETSAQKAYWNAK